MIIKKFYLKLEEQLLQLKASKKTKKEIESSWDNERKELHHTVQSMQIFMKDLQSQLEQRNINTNASTEDFIIQDNLQSIIGENEFLKNRIKEVNR